MAECSFRQAGEADTAIVAGLLAAAAQWLRQRGQEMWLPHEVSEDAIAESVAAGDFHVLVQDGVALATCKLLRHDPLFWPEIGPDESLFLHRIAIARQAAASGVLARLVAHAESLARQVGRRSLCRRPFVLARPLRTAWFYLAGSSAGQGMGIVPLLSADKRAP